MILDGGLGTELQGAGLPAGVAADTWVMQHPRRVRQAHEAFVQAGAQIVCTATLCTHTSQEGWAKQLEQAVHLAQGLGAEVYLSLGPGSDHGRMVSHVADQIDGVVLETFVDIHQAEQALHNVRKAYEGPCVVSVVPLPQVSVPALRQLGQKGATGLGLNCMPASRLLQVVPHLSSFPLWLKPSGDDFEQWMALAPYATWLGGCCGLGPSGLARRVARLTAEEGP